MSEPVDIVTRLQQMHGALCRREAYAASLAAVQLPEIPAYPEGSGPEVENARARRCEIMSMHAAHQARVSHELMLTHMLLLQIQIELLTSRGVH